MALRARKVSAVAFEKRAQLESVVKKWRETERNWSFLHRTELRRYKASFGFSNYRVVYALHLTTLAI